MIKGTHHANKRISQRLNITRKKERAQSFTNAVRKGFPRSRFSGSFRQYLDSKSKNNMSVKVYNNFVYIHKNKTVITVFPVPKKYLPVEDYLANFMNSPLLENLYKLVNPKRVSFTRISKDTNVLLYSLNIDGLPVATGEDLLMNVAKENAIREFLKLKKEADKLLIKYKTHKQDPYLDLYKCPNCGNLEYYGMLQWRDQHQYCRNCIYTIWVKENPNGWKPGKDDYVFPKYEDGINYYEKDGEYFDQEEKEE